MTLASKLTVLRIVFAPVIVVIAALGFPNWNLYAAAIFIVASITDTLDGHIARKYNQISDFGKLIDPIADKLLTSAAMIVLIAWHKFPFWVGLLLITRDIMVSAMRVTAADKNLVVAARNSGKIKTLLQLCAYGAYFFNFDLIGHILLAGGLATTLWSLFDYLYANRHVMAGSLLPPYILSFIDKIIITYPAFILLASGQLPGWIAMIILGKDNIISGVRAMASAGGHPIPLRLSEMACFALSLALLILLALGQTWQSGPGLALSLLSCATAVICAADVSIQSRSKPVRVK
jgi:CDP-diacylglycerol--glycerol-3-phosphate 3-phosphatidyltransferase